MSCTLHYFPKDLRLVIHNIAHYLWSSNLSKRFPQLTVSAFLSHMKTVYLPRKKRLTIL